MSLDVTLYFEVDTGGPDSPDRYRVFEANYTHNVTRMAEKAGLYTCVWRPEECGIETARDLIEPLRNGIKMMEDDPITFIELNPASGWGSYDTFLPWLRRYLEACLKYPKAKVYADR